MLNINFCKEELEHLKKNGFYVEQGKDIITIRNIQGETIGEIIYIEEYNLIILMNKDDVHLCKSINGIHEYCEYVYVNIRTSEGIVKKVRL